MPLAGLGRQMNIVGGSNESPAPINVGLLFSNEQPHKFKGRVLKELKLDYYIDDNWGIVDYLNQKKKNNEFRTEIHWVSNFIEMSNPYLYKHKNLETFLHHIGKSINK